MVTLARIMVRLVADTLRWLMLRTALGRLRRNPSSASILLNFDNRSGPLRSGSQSALRDP
jgi:hypothetical protein